MWAGCAPVYHKVALKCVQARNRNSIGVQGRVGQGGDELPAHGVLVAVGGEVSQAALTNARKRCRYGIGCLSVSLPMAPPGFNNAFDNRRRRGPNSTI